MRISVELPDKISHRDTSIANTETNRKGLKAQMGTVPNGSSGPHPVKRYLLRLQPVSGGSRLIRNTTRKNRAFLARSSCDQLHKLFIIKRIGNENSGGNFSILYALSSRSDEATESWAFPLSRSLTSAPLSG